MMTLGRWVTIDGVEGAGKTSLVERLSQGLNIDVSPEFSDATFGVALQRAVVATPHFISRSAVGQSLVFLGDYFEVFESSVLPGLRRGKLVVSDRGPLSKLVYQTVVLEETLGLEPARKLVESILELLAPPDLTVYLRCPLRVIERRLAERDGSCTDLRIEFIRRCDRLIESLIQEGGLAKNLICLDATQPIEMNEAAVVSAIEDLERRVQE
jgi:dTMP kinase